MRNAFTVDLEDWFCVRNLRHVIAADAWEQQPQRVEAPTRRLLELLAAADARGTFFVLGWTAERFPDLIREVEAAGHEIACHSYSHRMVSELTPDEFREDLARALTVLRDIVDQPVIGFRAPSFSITTETSWAFDIMAELGIRYDSSIFPFGGHPDYGIADAPLTPWVTESGVIEFPMAVTTYGRRRVPTGGGGYFRLLPYGVTRSLMRRVNRGGRSVPFYIHPWELDPGQPRVDLGSRTKSLRHYTNLASTDRRLERLLTDFRFTSMDALLGDFLAES